MTTRFSVILFIRLFLVIAYTFLRMQLPVTIILSIFLNEFTIFEAERK